MFLAMNSSELKRYLAKHGCTFDTRKGKGGHIKVIRGEHVAALPVHGKNKELPTGTVQRILKDLGLK